MRIQIEPLVDIGGVSREWRHQHTHKNTKNNGKGDAQEGEAGGFLVGIANHQLNDEGTESGGKHGTVHKF